MMLSDRELIHLAVNHKLVDPFIEKNCQGATINITLDSQVKVYNSEKPIILGAKIPPEDYDTVDISEEEFFLMPNQSALIQSIEVFNIPDDMSAFIYERYGVKLTGLMISPASYMNPGYEGRLSFLAINHMNVPIRLVPGIEFSQVALFKLSSKAIKPYPKQRNASYLGSRDVNTSMLHLDTEIQGFLSSRGIDDVSNETAKDLGDYLMGHIKDAAKDIADMLRKEYKTNQ
ncbi:dCTP deaminase [Neobacillus sp. NPDC058068]|uniref:dCTP deaminase n=1 Tax=Neobacillus sp. NPDC058068 TaxID=3346325 RepID=UPI0036DD0E11